MSALLPRSARGVTRARTSKRKGQSAKILPVTPPEEPAVTDSPPRGERRTGARQTWLVLAALVAVLLLTNFNVVFLGQSLIASANYPPFDDRFTHLRPVRGVDYAFANWHDLGGTWWQWEPAAVAVSNAYRRGKVPLWDPTIAGGVDVHASLFPSQYFPPYLPVLLLGNTPLLRDAYYLAVILVSGMGMAGLLLRNRFRPVSAAAGGVAYMLCGSVTHTVNSNLGQATAMLPLLLLVADWLLDRPSGPRLAATASVVAASILAGFLPVVFSGFLLVGLLAVAHAVVPPEAGTGGRGGVWRRLRPLLAAAGAGLLGVALAAFLIVPVEKASSASAEFDRWYTGVGRQAYLPNEFLTLVSPLLSWDVDRTQIKAATLFPPVYPGQAHLFYVGLVVLLLAFLARPADRFEYRRSFLAFGLMSAVVFAKLFGLPPVQWLADLPVLRYTHFIPYFCGALAVGLSGLAACGVESITGRVPRRSDLLRSGALLLVVMGSLALFVLARGFNRAALGTQYLRWALELDKVAVAAVGVLVVVWLRRREMLAGETAGVVAVGLIVFELAPLAYHGRYGRTDVWRDAPEYVRFLQRDPARFRIHSIQDLALTPNVFQAFGIQGIGSRVVFNQARYTALVKSYFATAANSSFILPTQLLPTNRVVLDLLNVKYVVVRDPTAKQRDELAAGGLEEAAADGKFVIFRNPTCWPRTYVTRRYRVVGSLSEALAEVATLTGPNDVILEVRPGFDSDPAGVSEGGTCRIAEYHTDAVTLDVDSAGPAMVVLLDSFGPGWTARVDGVPAPILPANGAFRGVEVPGGHVVVTMQYETPGLRPGLVVSGLALAVAALCLTSLVQRRRPA